MTRLIRGSIEQIAAKGRQPGMVRACLVNVPETIEPELRDAGWQREVGSGGAEWHQSLAHDPRAEQGPGMDDLAASLHSFMGQFADEIVRL